MEKLRQIYSKPVLLAKIEFDFEDNKIEWNEYKTIKDWLETLN